MFIFWVKGFRLGCRFQKKNGLPRDPGSPSQNGFMEPKYYAFWRWFNTPCSSAENDDWCLLGCPWKLVTIVSKLGYSLLTGRIQPTFIGVIIHLLSTMDIPVGLQIHRDRDLLDFLLSHNQAEGTSRRLWPFPKYSHGTFVYLPTWMAYNL